MASMDTDEQSVVLSSNVTSGLSLSLHPLPILNISEHLTRLKLQTKSTVPFVLGALLGTQNGREVEIVNSFELATELARNDIVDHGFLVQRRDQYKQVFPSLEFIGWYTVASTVTSRHIALHEQFTGYCSTPLLLVLQCSASSSSTTDITGQTLPFRAYEPSVEIRERRTRSVFIEVPFRVETGEAERIAVDWTARGGGGSTSLESHLHTQQAAVKMLHERILVLVQYVANAIAGQVPKDHTILRSLSALIASLPASESNTFREEFNTVSPTFSRIHIALPGTRYPILCLCAKRYIISDLSGNFIQEYEDVKLTAFLSVLTKSTNTLGGAQLVDKHLIMNGGMRDERPLITGPRRRLGRPGGMPGDWSAHA